MTHFLRLSAALMCLAVAWCAYRASLAFDAVTVAAAEAPQAFRAALVPVSQQLNVRIASLEAKLLGTCKVVQLHGTPTRVCFSGEEVGLLPGLVDAMRAEFKATLSAATRTGVEANLRFGDTLARADRAIASIEGLRADLKPTLENAASITRQTKEALPMFLDCVQYDESTGEIIGNNPSCLFNRFQGTTKAAEQAFQNMAVMSKEVKETLPKLTESAVGIGKSADGIAADVHTATSDFVKPRSGWQKFKAAVFDVGKIAARFL